MRDEPLAEFAVIMPCLNEARTVQSCVKKAKQFFESRNIKAHIIVADNGSTDDSCALAHQSGAHVVHVPERGYGAALHHGIITANAPYIIMGDADDSYDFSALDKFILELRAGNDLVMGNRFLGGIDAGAMPWLHRYLGNPFFSWFAKILFKSRINDVYCGLRGFSKKAYLEMNMCSKGMEFAVELVVKMHLFKKQVCEVPVVLRRDGRDRAPHLKTWHDGWRTFRFMLLLSPQWVFQFPAVVLLTLGLSISTLLVNGPLSLGNANFDIHTLLIFSMFVPLGIQLYTFGVFARIFSVSTGLLPKPSKREFFYDLLSLEFGIIFAAVFFVIGISIILLASLSWIEQGFSGLEARVVMRWLIPSTVSIIVGVQILVASFIFSILKLPLANNKNSLPS